jgi:SAM-dependent methyltransferase
MEYPSIHSYGLSIGLKSLTRGKVRQALPKLIAPVNYWRRIEYDFVLRNGQFQKNQRVLDIGSPKLLSLYLARFLDVDVHATDIDGYFVADYEFMRQLDGIPKERYHVSVEDGRKLSFPDNSFDRVYSVSTLEHIPDTGDTACIKEVARVLKPSGRCLLTVPVWPHSRVDYLEQKRFYWAKHSVEAPDSKIFYQRRYDERELFERLVKPSGLKLEKIEYVGEKVLHNSNKELVEFLPPLTGPVHPLMSSLFHTKPVERWTDLKKPLAGMIVLTK